MLQQPFLPFQSYEVRNPTKTSVLSIDSLDFLIWRNMDNFAEHDKIEYVESFPE